MRGLTLMRFLAAVNGLINVAGGKAPAAHSAYVISFLRGTFRNDKGELEPFLMSDGIGVGWGARPYADGTDAVYFVAQENYPVEFLETGYPVRLRTYGILVDSCGAGRYRGGCGIVREYDILAEEAVLAVRIDSVKNPPWGIDGGMAGGTGRVVVNPGTNHERVLAPLSDGNVLKHGDVLRIETGGGGGHGHPFDRPPEMVAEDVAGGFVTADTAQRLYGVVLVDGVGRQGRHRQAAGQAAGDQGVPPPRLCRQPWLTHRSRSPSTSAAPSPTSPCTTPRAARSGAPRRRACRPIPARPSWPACAWPWKTPAARRRHSAACCTARPSPPT